MYYNTTKESGNELKFITNKSKKQDDKIKSFFKQNPNKEAIASEVWINLFDATETPLTSIRRSINTLMNAGIIKQVLNEDKEPLKRKCQLFGRKVFIYKLS